MSTPKPTIDIEGVAPRTSWLPTLREAAIEVFSTMAGATVTAPPDNTDNHVLVLSQITGMMVTGMIGIAGPLSATLSLCCSTQSAIKMASQMLGVTVEEATAQQCDAVGEICNIVAGYFKAKIGLGDRCSLSVPTVLAGKDYKIRSPGKDARLELFLLYERAPLCIALDIRP